MRWRRIVCRLVVAAGLVAAPACAGDDDGPGTVTGRVMSLDRERGRACVSPDRGESETCVEVADPGADLQGIEVGGCAVLDPTARRLQGADDADCAAGDLGG